MTKQFTLLFLSMVMCVLLLPAKFAFSDDGISVSVPETDWVRTYGGENDDGAYSITQTDDGGYLVVGYTRSYGQGESDIYVLKLDAAGEKEWQETHGSMWYDAGITVRQTSDGGYMIAGVKSAFLLGGKHIYALKLRRDGRKEWDKFFGVGMEDIPAAMVQTLDGGYVLVGSTDSPWANGGKDVLAVKLNSKGKTIWVRRFSGRTKNDVKNILKTDKDDVASSVAETPDGGLAIVGYTTSFGAAGKDVLILKLNQNGIKEWSKTFGNFLDDVGMSVYPDADGSLLVAGFRQTLKPYKDAFVVKVDAMGRELWHQSYGGPYDDVVTSVAASGDGGYILAGQTFLSPYDHGNMYIIKIASDGAQNFEKTITLGLSSGVTAVTKTYDGGYVLAGYAMSTAFARGEGDIYVIKLSAFSEQKKVASIERR